ncbi:MAG: sensory box histidine kinase/response regulator [Myxococcaceae bacterium]|nr:sensory box histidine kinase/response regulator [Myxococcaceae bacterium]
MGELPRSKHLLATVVLVAALYVATGYVGMFVAIPPGNVTAVWLPSGIALAALLLAGRGVWPGVAVGSLVTNLIVLARLGGVPPAVTLVIAAATAVGSTLQGLAGAAVIERFARGRRALHTPNAVAVLFAAILAVCSIAATAGVGALLATGRLPAVSFPSTWLTWWLGDVGGVVLVTPIALSFQERAAVSLRRGGGVLLAVLALAPILHDWPLRIGVVTMSSYLALPLVVFAALRVGTRGVSLAVFAVYGLMLWATARGRSPFSAGTINAQLLQLDGYLVALSATGLVLAASVRERDAVSRALREARADLEARVAARTEGLVAANRALSAEIHERQRVEGELGRSDARLRTAVDCLPFDFWVCDADGRYVLQNATSIRHWGDLRGKLPAEAGLPPEVLAAWQQNNARALAGEVVRQRIRQRYDGVDGAFDKLVAPVRVDGQVVGFLGLNFDVTERERMAEELVRAQRLEATGRLAGGIAHDFNNLLTVMTATATSIERRAGDAPTQQAAGLILEAARRAADLTRQLLAFAGKQRVAPEVRRIDGLVEEVSGLLRPILPSNIELRVEHEAPDAAISIDPTQFSQVLVNLAMNARDAMPADGALTIRSAVVAVDERAAEELHVTAGRFVRLEVQDTGVGIEPAVLARAFEPFFTTRPVGRGSGLGLSSVHGIATQAGGAVQLRSAVGVGTTAVVYFPRAGGPLTVREVARVGAEAGGGETVLVVEDQSLVRDVIAEMLGDAGYRVITAVDGEDALRVIDAHEGAIDLVLTDLVMPRMGGALLGQRLRERALAMPIVYMSGYAEGREDRVDGPRLAKPFGTGELTATVHAALKARAATA